MAMSDHDDSLEGAFDGHREDSINVNSDQQFMQRMMEYLVSESRRNNEVMTKLIDRLTPNPNTPPVSVESGTFHVMPDLSKVIDTFNGEKGSAEAESWLENVQTSATLNRWPDSYTQETARAHLRGAARDWYRCKSDLINTWSDFKVEFRKTFVKTIRLADRWDEMQKRRQGKNEPVSSYFHEKLKLCKRLNLGMEEAKEEILGGLYQKDVAMSLVTNEYRDYDSLLHAIVRVERVKNFRSESSISQSVEKKPEKSMHKVEERDANINSVKRETKVNRCYKCGQLGHLAAQCKKNVVCFKCKKEGHISTNCSNNERINVVSSQSLNSQVKRETMKRNFVIDGCIVLKGFIDTGSSVCTIRECVVDKFKLNVLDEQQPLFGFGNVDQPAMLTRGKIIVRLEVDKVCEDKVELLVVPNDAQDMDLLVGQTFLERPRLSFTKRGKCVIFNYMDQDPLYRIDELAVFGQPSKMKVRAVEDVNLASRCVSDVNVKIDEKDMVLRIYNATDRNIVQAKEEILAVIQDDRYEKSLPAIEKCRRDITMDMLNIEVDVPDEKKEELVELVAAYRDCFALEMGELGCTKAIEMEIIDQGKPVRSLPYKTSAADRETIAELVAELKKHGLVTDTNSPYASPVLLVRKKNGDPRLVVDYRMAHVDALSRAPVEETIEGVSNTVENRLGVLLIDEYDEVCLIQRQDEKLTKIIRILQKPQEQLTNEEKNLSEAYELEDNRLMVNRRIAGEERKLFVVPDSMRKTILVRCHDLVGHFSVERTVSRILQNYWFRGVRRYARRHIAACVECLFNKIPGGRKAGELHPIPPTTRPFQRVHADHLGPFVKSSRGFSYLLVIVDSFSRFVSLFATKSTKTTAVIRCFKRLFLRFGVTQTLITDQGTCFTSKTFAEFCQENGIRHIKNSPRHAQANGMVERVNRVIVPVVQAEMSSEARWDQNLEKIEYDINSSVNKTTRKTPYEVLMGYNPTLERGDIQERMHRNNWVPPNEEYEKLRRQIHTEQQRYKIYHDRKRYIGQGYDVGEIVVVRNNPAATGESLKLKPKYKGPYAVIQKLPADTYRLEEISNGKKTTAHVSQMKGYYNHVETDDETEIGNMDTEEEEVQDQEDHETVEQEENGKCEMISETLAERPKRIRKRPRRLLDYVEGN